jgi:hypothetical protein|nr:MAG TPA: PROTEIN/RNA Complex, archaeal, ribosomal, 50S, protein.0A [Caudoviricetes sp.]
MTPQETLKSIEKQTNAFGVIDKLYVTVEEYCTIKQALEKQIPKKAIGIYDENISIKNDNNFHYEQVLIGSCPNCNQEVQDGMKFCMECGQALNFGKKKGRKWND